MMPVDEVEVAGLGFGDGQRLLGGDAPPFEFQPAQPIVEECVVQIEQVIRDHHRHVSRTANI
jgi:hypothetical protein